MIPTTGYNKFYAFNGYYGNLVELIPEGTNSEFMVGGKTAISFKPELGHYDQIAVRNGGIEKKRFAESIAPCDLAWLPVSLKLTEPGQQQESMRIVPVGRSPFFDSLKRDDFFECNGGSGLLVDYPVDERDEDETIFSCGTWQNFSANVYDKFYSIYNRFWLPGKISTDK